MKREIVVVGSANLDLVCNASSIPAPGQTLWGERFQTFQGGKGANQAVAAARLGADVSMVAKVGSDSFGATLRDGLTAAGVRTDHVLTAQGASSGVAMITVDAAGQNSIVVVAGANGMLSPEDLDQCMGRLQSAGILLAQLESPMPTVEYLARIAENEGIPFVLDPAPARELSTELLRKVTYLTPNESETAYLCGLSRGEVTVEDAKWAAAELQGRGAKNVILKMGRHGVYLATAEGTRRFLRAFPVDAVDTTAAGDAFNGAFATALMRGDAAENAVMFAMAVGALAVTRPGAQSAMPTAQEVERFLQQHRREDFPANATLEGAAV